MLRRVLYISPGIGLGGGEMSLITLIKHLDKSRYAPLVCAYGMGPFIERIQQIGCPWEVLSYGGAISQALFIFKLAALIRRSQADLVHVNTLDIRAGLAARMTGRALVGHLRVIFPTTWVDRLFVRLAHRTVSVSNAARNHFCQIQGTPFGTFETVYNAVDISDPIETQTDLRMELGLQMDTPIIGAVGRIDPWKGFETFVEAANMLHETHPDTHYIIAGSPGPAPEEQQYAKHLHDQVNALDLKDVFHFLGYRPDALDIIRQLDALVVPSRILETPEGIKTEGFGRVAAEGLAMRTPVIASRVGGLPEIIIDGQTGHLFDESNATDLARAVAYLLAHPNHCKALIESGYKRYQTEFSVTPHVTRIQTLYDSLIETSA